MRARTYRLEVEGEVSQHSWIQLEGMTLKYSHGNTVLLGLLRDQAELQGLLQRVSDLGLTLLSVHALEDVSENGARRA
jgi:hypothetical protein